MKGPLQSPCGPVPGPRGPRRSAVSLAPPALRGPGCVQGLGSAEGSFQTQDLRYYRVWRLFSTIRRGSLQETLSTWQDQASSAPKYQIPNTKFQISCRVSGGMQCASEQMECHVLLVTKSLWRWRVQLGAGVPAAVGHPRASLGRRRNRGPAEQTRGTPRTPCAQRWAPPSCFVWTSAQNSSSKSRFRARCILSWGTWFCCGELRRGFDLASFSVESGILSQ